MIYIQKSTFLPDSNIRIAIAIPGPLSYHKIFFVEFIAFIAFQALYSIYSP